MLSNLNRWNLLLLFTGLLFLPGIASTQTYKIETIAGDKSAGYYGAKGQVTPSQLDCPEAIASDAYGNIYIADATTKRIEEISTNGTVTCIAGNGLNGYSGDGGPATDAELSFPWGVAVDGSGNIYIADDYDNCIRKVNTGGLITTIAGNGFKVKDGSGGYTGDGGPATSAELSFPAGVAVDAVGNVYVCDRGNQCIRKVNTRGVISTIAKINDPLGIAVDGYGNIYVADHYSNRIRKIDHKGIVSVVAGNGYQGNQKKGGYSGDDGPAEQAELYYPHGLSVDAKGNLYIADQFNHCVRKVNTNGVISTIAGTGTPGYTGDGGPSTAAQISYPSGITLDAAGNIYVAEQKLGGGCRIRKLNTSTPNPTVAELASAVSKSSNKSGALSNKVKIKADTSSHSINVDVFMREQVTITILDKQGEDIGTYTMDNGHNIINTEAFPTTAVYMQIKTQDGLFYKKLNELN